MIILRKPADNNSVVPLRPDPEKMAPSVLVVEDNADIAHLVKLHLGDAGYAVHIAGNGRSAITAIGERKFDLLILDLMLPDVDGLELCRRIRSGSDYLPILMLTSKSSEHDRVLGLETGADDYLTKPFSVLELLARVKAILRRIEVLQQPNGSKSRHDRFTVGNLSIDRARRRAHLAGERIELTAREFDLLCHFARHPGQVFTRAQLLDSVWGHSHDGYEHTVNSHINRLRAKMEKNPAKPRYLLTVWGVGYKLADPGEQPLEIANRDHAV
jgi:two-component system OmpR family response regulator